MKTRIPAQSEVPATPSLVVSHLAPVPTSVAIDNAAVTDTQIRELAYRLYEERERIDGKDLQDWFEAESILREQGKLAA